MLSTRTEMARVEKLCEILSGKQYVVKEECCIWMFTSKKPRLTATNQFMMKTFGMPVNEHKYRVRAGK